ncbi:MAG: nickel-dependent hydrogenase large subunit [Sulfolobales archaeon]|nr:nickel-dependent hydrogenase large subunit [Sulfolobales archaeon]MCX8208657.1 nickel-dependent hydrogenase large subunit [Sulfolobales archaeon]MDW8010315.1 nickel-dependent hydrogenase large subunit [Sulfolobales archaeon]
MLAGLLTRVEGEGQVVLKSFNGVVSGVEVRVSEAPRFFEYIVRGRRYSEVPDLTSRICGLCGVSYALTASKAFESCLSIDVAEDEERLRLAMLAAERVKSHMIHIALLHLPDFLELRSLKELAESYPHIYSKSVEVVLWSRKAMEVLGGRFHNVLNLRVGGVYGFPETSKVEALRRELPKVLDNFLDVARFVLSLGSIPTEVHELRYMAVSNGTGYPWVGGSVVADKGSPVSIEVFENFVLAEQARYSNALRYRLAPGESYVVGPLARYNLHSRFLRREVREFLSEFGYGENLRNLYQSVVARIAETHQTLLELEEFLSEYRERSVSEARPRSATPRSTCAAVTEAPRGVLYHRYDLDSDLRVRSSNIITPTAQNLASMEDAILSKLSGSSADGRAIEIAKKIVRCYDPCISCSVHIIQVT